VQAESALTPDQRGVLELIDGFRDVQAIMDASHLVEFDVARAMYGLAVAGMIQRAGARVPRMSRGVAQPSSLTSEGIAQFFSGQLIAAESSFESARRLTADGLSAAWYHFAALTAALRGDLPRAADLLSEGIVKHPHHATLANNLAVILERRGMLAEARRAIDRGMDVSNALPQLHKNLGDLHFVAGRSDEAFSAYSRARAIDPALGDDLYLKIGSIHAQRLERDEAKRALERALSINPRNDAVKRELQSLGKSPS
jgi:tetratricopeptide (TPR) repeat protein